MPDLEDKKISELPIAASINNSDVSVLVNSGMDYQYTFTVLIAFLQSQLTLGCTILFQDATPSAGTGVNGDVVIKPTTGQFWQKNAGAWVLKYTVPTPTSGNTIIYGATAPNVATGANGDTYIKTDGGVFYQKVSGAWIIKFTMATGPAGATGADGAAGSNGTNGNTILNGIVPPSNIDDGVNGDFYINTSISYLYGPKAAGVWPVGVPFSNTTSNFKQSYPYDVGDTRFNYNSLTFDLTFTLTSAEQLLFPYDPEAGSILAATIRQNLGTGIYKEKKSFDPIITDDGTSYISVLFEGVDSDLITNCDIILF